MDALGQEDRPAPELSIIIVNWKSADFVKKCLHSLYHWTQDVRFEVIVIDSASYDGCGEMLAAEFPRVQYVQSAENIGFGRSNNLGASRARGTELLLLNPDTELQENSLPTLLRRLRTLPQAGAVGCRLINSDGTLQTSCVQAFPTVMNQLLDSDFLRRLFPQWEMWGTRPLHHPEPTKAEVVSGACILIPKDVYDAIGGFSPDYFMYGEDIDLCYKVRLSGRAVYYVPETTIVHHGGGSTRKTLSNFSNVMMRESVYRFFRRHRGNLSAAAYRATTAGASVVRMFLLLPRVLARRPSSLSKWFSILRWSLGVRVT